MAYAIITKHLSPTATKPARIKASAADGAFSLIVSYDHALEERDNHRAVAEALAKNIWWTGGMVQGYIKGGHYAFVFID